MFHPPHGRECLRLVRLSRPSHYAARLLSSFVMDFTFHFPASLGSTGRYSAQATTDALTPTERLRPCAMNTVLSRWVPCLSRPHVQPFCPNHPPAQPRHLRSFTLDLCSWPQQRTLPLMQGRGSIPTWVMRGLRTARRLGRSAWPNRVTMCHVRHVTLLRTGCSPPQLPTPCCHDAVASVTGGRTFRLTGLPPRMCGRFTGARARVHAASMLECMRRWNPAAPGCFALKRRERALRARHGLSPTDESSRPLANLNFSPLATVAYAQRHIRAKKSTRRRTNTATQRVSDPNKNAWRFAAESAHRTATQPERICCQAASSKGPYSGVESGCPNPSHNLSLDTGANW